MAYIFSSFFWLGISIAAHVAINKFRILLGISLVSTLSVFLMGLVGSVVTTMWLLGQAHAGFSLPYTSILLYVFCSLAYLSIAGGPMLGGESPTTKILTSLRRRGTLTKEQIFSLFTYDEVMGKRIESLIQSQWILKKNTIYFVTKRGKTIASFFIAYRRLLGLSQGG